MQEGTKACPMFELVCVDGPTHKFEIKCTAKNCPYEDRACPVPASPDVVFTYTRSKDY